MAGDAFSELLGQLKERSGLSYGVLGKRLHMSASTLHRYVNGDAVPTDYAPVERFARVCKATPEELVELHRRWVLADARRGQKGAPATPAPATPAPATPAPVTPAPAGSVPAPESVEAAAEAGGEPEVGAEGARVSAPEAAAEPEAPVRRRRRTVVLAGAAVVAAAVSAAVLVGLVQGGGDDEGGGKQAVGAGAATVAESGTGGASADGKRRSSSPSASASASHSTSPSASASASRGGTEKGSGNSGGGVPLTVATKPYVWDSPCGQPYLLDQDPANVPPPPNEQEAPGWITTLGAVSGDEQRLTLTVQGTGEETAVLDALHVRVVGKGAPLAWNSYSMGFIGVGCGGPAESKSFDVNLDLANPDAVVKGGQRDFPYKVSESDPEVFQILAHAEANDVSWYLELDWSSGERSGTVRIDNKGRPFRTSGTKGRPVYGYPLGGDAWERTDGE
ncbi:helix-turn-helix domain-containing protein [Streptomyces sp. NPDC059785]|uniref:helix-turn-helix domain-containing protein n=1 Tax=Streptomyces sp. NPDC059785 TaxID=3346945 RepID=UPI0036656C42